ncbi:MAG: pseudouridine synthase [Candidatus Woesearchaeota archaeon]|jgi:pseudouridine synthase
MSKKLTLYQALKKSGLFKDKDELSNAVNNGKITVDGIVTKALQFQFSPNKRKVCFDGKEINFIEKKYYVINKTLGYSCQKNDKAPYVVDIFDFPEQLKNSLFSVGRLDFQTTGLLIVTNDGDFAQTILSEKVSKTYKVITTKEVIEPQIQHLKDGVLIHTGGEEYITKPAQVKRIDAQTILVTIHEGKHRQVRKMMKAIGNDVISLERVAIGGINIKLEEGKWKEYSEEEIKKIIK